MTRESFHSKTFYMKVFVRFVTNILISAFVMNMTEASKRSKVVFSSTAIRFCPWRQEREKKMEHRRKERGDIFKTCRQINWTMRPRNNSRALSRSGKPHVASITNIQQQQQHDNCRANESSRTCLPTCSASACRRGGWTKKKPPNCTHCVFEMLNFEQTNQIQSDCHMMKLLWSGDDRNVSEPTWSYSAQKQRVTVGLQRIGWISFQRGPIRL